MKKFLLILAVVAMAAACVNSDTDETGALGKLPISISLNVEPSRANDTTFESGDQLGLYVVNHTNAGAGSLANYNNHIDNMRFTLSSDWTPDESIYWLDHSTKADFYAYYPYGEVSNVKAYEFSVKNDQSNEANYWASDFLWGKRTNVAPTADAVAIETEHLFSNALVYVVAGEGVSAEMLAEADVEVTVCNVKTSATINLATGTATATGAYGEIKPWNTGSYYRAMIVPQSVSSSNDLLLVKINGEEYTYATNITFEQGTRHKITITVESSTDFPSNKFNVTFSIKPWNDDEFDYGGSLNKKEEGTNDNYVTILSTNYEGADIAIKVPEHIKQQNRRIRWGVTNIAMLEYNGNPSLPEMLFMHDHVYPASIIARDTVLNINHKNAYRRNEKGEIGYYVIDSNGVVSEVAPDSPEVQNGEASPIQYYFNFQPGEPLVLMLMEADYADCDCSDSSCAKKHPTIDFDWGAGWYWFPYDMEAYLEAHYGSDLPNMGVGGSTSTVDPEQFWHEGAWYRQIELRLPGPEKFAGSVDVSISNLSSNSGTITFTPDDKTSIYLVGLYEETDQYGSGFKDITNTYLNGDESLWQWFTTTELGGYFGVQTYYASDGMQFLKLEDYFASLTPGGKYHLVVNALPGKYDGNGNLVPDPSAQNFQHIEFELKNYTLPEPELVVTAVDPYSPWKVKFNVKNPDWKTNPVTKVSCTANFTRDYNSYMEINGYNYTDMVMMNAYNPNCWLSDADLKLVNSNAGADIEFDVSENSSFTLAVIGWNTEGRASNPDSSECPGYATAKSLPASAAEALDMTKLNALKGEWTATAQVNVYDPNKGEHVLTQRSWKVTIGDLNANQALSSSDYAMFERHGVSQSAANAYLAEYNQLAANYNSSVRGQNRVLCQGWQIDDDRALSTASPWDLFLMEDYSTSSVDYLFYDFGPKWFLQVDADGNVFIPVHYNRIPPLTYWYNGTNHYLCGANYESGYAFYVHPYAEYRDNVQAAGLPVTISADGNTVTITGYTVLIEDGMGGGTDLRMYPNIVYDYNSQIQFYNSYVVSDVVLTRGWNETRTSTPTKMSAGITNSAGKRVVNITDYKAPAKPYSRTVLVPQDKAKVEAKQITAKQPTREEIDENMKKMMKRFSLGR